jgi:hypothetical protein
LNVILYYIWFVQASGLMQAASAGTGGQTPFVTSLQSAAGINTTNVAHCDQQTVCLSDRSELAVICDGKAGLCPNQPLGQAQGTEREHSSCHDHF